MADWTPEIIKKYREVLYSRIDDLNCEMEALVKTKSLGTIKAELTALNRKLDDLTSELIKLEFVARCAGWENKSDEEIIADIKVILDAVTQDDYLQCLSQQEKPVKEGYESCFSYLYTCLICYMNAVNNDRKSTISNKIIELARQKALQWYPKEQERSPRSKAAEAGTLMTLKGHVASYSSKELESALTTHSIYRISAKIDRDNMFDKKTGEMDTLVLLDKPLEELTEVHAACLMFIAQVASTMQIEDDNYTAPIPIYLPAICRELRIDPRTYSKKRTESGKTFAEIRLQAFIDILQPFEPLVGKTPEGGYYRLATFQRYEPETETAYITAPYFLKIGAKKPKYNRLLHANIIHEPNIAVEVANRVLTGLLQRGTTRPDDRTYSHKQKITKKTITKTDSDGNRTTTTITYDNDNQQEENRLDEPPKYTWSVPYRTLLIDCPMLKHELERVVNSAPDKATATRNLNKRLDDIFSCVFHIILEKSDAPGYFKNLTLPTVMRTVNGKKQIVYRTPTKSALQTSNLTITHEGKNKDFAL